MNSIPEIFSSMVFNDKVMRERLPKTTYKELQKTIKAVSYTHLLSPSGLSITWSKTLK